MRAIWERSEAELQSLPRMARPFASALFAGYRIWDYAAAGRVDVFVANSGVTQRRIKRHYGRDSVVLPPPIDVERFTIGVPERQETEKYYLVASRPVPYKRVDIAVGACLEMGRRVFVAGGDHKGLPNDPRVIQVGSVHDGELLELMRGAEALLFPQEEDFGMTPLEMNACGRPTIAYGVGGALETVIDGETGILVASQDVRSFAEGIARCESLKFEPERLREHALSFSQDSFIGKLRNVVLRAWIERGC
jgi:glycosyltransferase involved in cell wall biosynthesis